MTPTSNEWSAETYIIVIGGCRPSIMGRNLMPQLGLQLVQADVGDVMNIQEPSEQPDKLLDEWQLPFSK